MTDAKQQSVEAALRQAYEDLHAARKKIADLRGQLKPEPVEDYELKDLAGKTVKLSDLFGSQNDLILIHNMGKGCRYCTLWADGFNGEWRHLADRAAFVLVSADDPSTAREFSAGRGWAFPVYSNDGGEFTRAMGYEDEKGNPHPGVSTFHRDTDGTIRRVAHAPFGPGDEFCGVWPLLDMLKDGVKGWEPQYQYD